jgi:hypothetical protein
VGEAIQRQGRCVDVECCAGRSRDNDVGSICEEGPLNRIGDLLCEVDSSDILRTKRREQFDGLEDLVGKLASWDEN